MTSALRLPEPDYQQDNWQVYDLDDRLLLVATDQITVAGWQLPDRIPAKGQALTQLVIYWYELFASIIGINLLSADPVEFPPRFRPLASELGGRSLLVQKLPEIPLDCRVVGYLTTTVWPEYQASQTVGGVAVEGGLQPGGHLTDYIYVPFLEEESHQPISLQQSTQRFGHHDAMVVCSNTLELYGFAASLARSRGFLLAEAAFHFASFDNQIILTGVPTPDNSLFWSATEPLRGADQPGWERQPLLDWLAANAEGQSSRPPLPEDLLAALSQRYIQLYEALSA
ncbi:MAG: hypothetical protein FWC59_00405, partial [Actinomycetia bacterium]|nr:hypothetical protein [Actinomycetes bacterium]